MDRITNTQCKGKAQKQYRAEMYRKLATSEFARQEFAEDNIKNYTRSGGKQTSAMTHLWTRLQQVQQIQPFCKSVQSETAGAQKETMYACCVPGGTMPC